MPVDAIVIADHVVCGYTSSAKTDENRLARDIKQALKNQHYEKITVKIFHDYKAFLARAEGMNNSLPWNSRSIERKSGQFEIL